MITQNPIVGRARKKLAGVYARTLWGKNVIQSCPTKSTTPPSQALANSRSAFGHIMAMANMVPKSLLYNIYYAAPIGRSRRHVLSSQLFSGVIRADKHITFDLLALSMLGTNPRTSTQALLYTAPAKSFSLAKTDFPTTSLADINRVPCIFAVSYDLGVCVPLLDYTTLNGDNIDFHNISDTLVGAEFLYICLWQTNVGTAQNPIWVYGGYQAEIE